MSPDPSVALYMRGIVKRYPGVVANDGISLSAARGEVHALMGENGAGKSTLMSILYGLVPPDAGTIELDGQALQLRSPLDAIAAGLGMIHQGFKLFESLSVWENIVYHLEPLRMRGLLLDRDAARAQVRALSERYGLAVDPDARVGALAVGVRQRVEILKALYRRARLLILDEPTAVLTPQERDGLFEVLRHLKADGCTILFVTHKIHEVLAVSDRITVLRDGKVSAEFVTASASAAQITQAMTGRQVTLEARRAVKIPLEVRLEARDLCVTEAGRRLVNNVNLQVRGGEIVGLAGVAGNGQSELVEALCGLRAASGCLHLNGLDVSGSSVARRRQALAYIPEDRAVTGTALGASARDNLGFGRHRQSAFSRWGLLRVAALRQHARQLIERFAIKIPSVATRVGTLSGGNLQKIVIARELERDAAVLIAEQPTRGVDVGAIEFIHAQLLAQRARGAAVLLVSAELSELMTLADRILVMYEGRIVADLPTERTSETLLGQLMAGTPLAAEAA